MADQISDSQNVRDQTKIIAEKARSDSSFAQRLRDDPINTLRGEGLPEQAIQELGSMSQGADVAGYCTARTVPVTDMIYDPLVDLDAEYNCTWFTTHGP